MNRSHAQLMTAALGALAAGLLVFASCGPDEQMEPIDSGGGTDSPAPDPGETGDSEPTGCIEETGDSEADADADADADSDSDSDSDADADTGPLVGCPSDMVSIEDLFCIDTWEASRQDATADSSGSDESVATSRQGVKPWKISSNEAAEKACQAADKRLCTPDEWYQACIGPAETAYAYGDSYEASTCNGIDTYCDCGGDACPDCTEPYAGCYSACGGSYSLLPTGSFPDCTNGYGVFDINGNLWEHIAGGDKTTVRGGAYNCGDSEAFHRCDYIPGWTPSALGFRCCHDGVFK